MYHLTKKLLAGLTLAAALTWMPQPLFAAPLDMPEHGIVLTGDEKQAYISEKTAGYFSGRLAPAKTFEAPDGWTWEQFTVGTVKAERMTADKKHSDRVILQLHGGAYVLGLGDSHRLLAVRQAVLTDASEVYYVDYRTAPEHVYPAALEDAAAVYKEMLAHGIAPEDIIVVGDSAGGNLAIELSLYLKEHGIAQPAVLVLASPWGTVEHLPSTSRTTKAKADQVLGEGTPLYIPVQEAAYAGTLDRKDPRLSPIYADLSGLPPMLIQAGGNELLLTDSLDLTAKAAADGVQVTLTVYEGMPHDFALLFPEMEDSVQSLQEIADFVNRYMD